jgi:hypothetical protein
MSQSDVKLYVGDSKTLECVNDRHSANVVWYFNDKIINQSNEGDTLKPDGNTLTISNATLELFGKISCQSQVLIDNTTYLTDDIVNISVDLKITTEINPAKIRVDEGELVKLTCNYTLLDPKLANSKSLLKFVWKKDGEILDAINSVLSLENISRQDTGEYSCKVYEPTSNAESNIANAYVKVGHDDPPSLEFDFSIRDDDYILRCEANSYAQLERLNISRLDSEITSHVFFGNESAQIVELHFVDQPENYGFYKCSAENEFGYAYKVLEIPRCN